MSKPKTLDRLEGGMEISEIPLCIQEISETTGARQAVGRRIRHWKEVNEPAPWAQAVDEPGSSLLGNEF